MARSPDGIGPEAEGLRIAARAAGIETDVVEGVRRGERQAWLRLHVDGRRFLFKKGILLHARDDSARPFGRHVNGHAALLTSDKHRTKATLAAAGIAVPEGRLFGGDAQDEAVAYGLGLGGEVCIKPNTGWAGRHVFAGLSRAPEMGAAFRKGQRTEGGVVVERSLPGEVLRLFYLAPDCVAAKLNRAPGVTGDGSATVAELIAGRDHQLVERRLQIHKPIRQDADMHRALKAQGLALDAVPEAGRRVRLGYVSNISRGADSLNGRAGTDPSYFAVAARACQACPGLRIGAIDMMVTERERPAAPGNHWVLEINSSPGFTDFLFPWSGAPQDVGGMIIAFLRREAARGADRPR